ncbi:transglycosylase SLT domain-containing protein [Clostridium sp. JNZ X4-2]
MAEIRARLSLEDDFSAQINKINGGLDDFTKSLAASKTGMKDFTSQKFETTIKVKDEATKKITEARKVMDSMKKNVAVTIAAKDAASESIRRVGGNLRLLGSKTFSPIIRAKDEASSVIKTVSDKLFNLKTTAAGIMLGVGAKQVFDSTVGAGARLEQEQVAMKHFIGNNNKTASSSKVQSMTDSFINQLRVNANVTPFGTNEVLAAGRRAVNIVNGDTSKSMGLVNLAENMAALNPGKSVMDAMEALADLKTGEFERMKEFGFKFSAQQFNGLVGKGQNDTLTDSEMNKAYDMTVKNKLNPVFAGGAKELSKTTAGQWSTTTGNVESILSDVGMVFLPAINKTLIPINASLDKLGKSKVFAGLQKEIGGLANAGGQKLQTFIKSFDNPAKVKQYANTIKTIGSDIKAVGTVGISYIKGMSTVLMPLIKTAAAHPKVLVGLFAGFTVGKGVLNAITTFGAIRKELPLLNTAIKTFTSGATGTLGKFFGFLKANPTILIIGAIIGACVLLYQAWKNNWGGIRDMTHTVVEFIKGKIDSIKDTFVAVKQHAADFVESIKEKWQALKDFFANPIQGTLKLAQKVFGKGVDKGNALGTSYYEGGATWVGEKGPEILVPPSESKILSNRQSMNMLNVSKNTMLPNMNTASWGKDIPIGMAKGIRDNTKPVTDSVTLMANKIRELIHFTSPDKGPLADFDTYPVDMMKTFGTGIQNNTKLVTTPTTNMSGNVKTIFGNLTTQSLSYGQQVVQQLGFGVQASASNLTAIVKTLTDKVINEFKTGFGIHSPSLVMYKMGDFLMQGLVNGMSSKDVGAFIKNWIGDITGAAGGAMGGNVTGWLSTALALTGTPMSWLPGLIQLVKRESGGNPMAYNGISVGGEHATGLMQMLGSTFRSYALPGLNNILNPIANVASAIRYIKATYGNVMSIPNLFSGNYKGYAVGLTRVPKDNFPALLHEDERVLTANEARNYDKKNNSKPNIIINMYGTTIRKDSDIDKIATALVKKLKAAAYNMA